MYGKTDFPLTITVIIWEQESLIFVKVTKRKSGHRRCRI
jgi:hypothetical protein